MSKISELTLASVANAPDLLYLVQGSTSKRITVDNFHRTASNIRLAGNVFVDAGNAQILTSSGTISLTTPLTELVVNNSGGLLTLPQGIDGQLKIITLTGTDNSNYYTVPNTYINASANLKFNSNGDSALLLYTNAKWQVLTISNDEMFENSIRYFSNARARAAIGAEDSTIIYYEANGKIAANLAAVVSGVSTVNGQTGTVVLTTANIAESSNLYFTNARVYANVIGLLGAKANVSDLTTANVTESGSLYFSNTRVQNYLGNVAGNILPSQSNTFNLGSPTRRWKTLYLESSTIDLGGTSLSVVNDSVQFANTANPNVTVTLIVPEIQIGSGNNTISLRANAETGGFESVGSSGDVTPVATHTSNLINDSGFINETNARQAISVTGSGTYDNTTGIISITGGGTTDEITEASNLYFTNARAILAVIPAATELVVTTPVFNYNIDSYSGDNPTIYVSAGETIAFDLNQSASHPLAIRVSNGGSNYNTGLTHVADDGTISTGASAQGKVSGKLFWKVPFVLAGNTYVYQCTNHSSMVGSIVIKEAIATLNTSNVVEGANLYFTNARVRAAISNTNGISYVQSTGVLGLLTSGVSSGTYGNASLVPVITVDTYGRITSVSNTAVSAPASAGNSFTDITVSGNIYGATYNRINVGGTLITKGVSEQANIQSTAPATINVDVVDSTLAYFSSNLTSNVTINFRANSTVSLDSFMAQNTAITLAVLLTNGPTAYIPNVITIDGVTQTANISWIGGAPVGGNPSNVDSYFFSVIKTNTTSYRILATQGTATAADTSTLVTQTISNYLSGGTNSGGLVTTGNITASGNIHTSANVSAANFVATGAGVPTLRSNTSINLSANANGGGGAVVVTNSAFRLSSFTTTGRGSLSPANGDVIYNTTTAKLQAYAGGTWVDLH